MRCPPLVTRPALSIADPLSEEGARQLAANIRRAWKRVGRIVDVRVERLASVAQADGLRSQAHFAVRSDLVNGMPRLAVRRNADTDGPAP